MTRRRSVKKNKTKSEFAQLQDEQTLTYIQNLRRSKSYPEELLRQSLKKLSIRDSFEETTDKSSSHLKQSLDEPLDHRYRMKSSGQLQSALVTLAIRDSDSIQLWRLLSRSDVDVNQMDGLGMQPIHYACMYGDTEIMKILMNFNINVNDPTSKGESPLEIAVREGNFEIAQNLIKCGAKVKTIVNGINNTTRQRAYTLPRNISIESKLI